MRADLLGEEAREVLLQDLLDFQVARENLSKVEADEALMQRLRQQLQGEGLEPARVKELENALARWAEHAVACRRLADAALRRQRYRMESWQGALARPASVAASASPAASAASR